VGAALTNRLRAGWSIVIRTSQRFRVAPGLLRMLLADVGVRAATLRIVQQEDFRVGKFPIDQLVRRNVRRVRLSMKICDIVASFAVENRDGNRHNQLAPPGLRELRERRRAQPAQ